MVNANIPPPPLTPVCTPPGSNMSHFSPAPYDTLHKFLHLIDNDSLIQVLLHCDRNYQVMDKWLIAIVYQYFLQARLPPHKYSRENFFLGLYLAIEFEEDEDRKVKDVLLDYLLHHDNTWQSKKAFVKKKDKFWKKLGFRCMVSRKRLEEIISINRYHEVWRRERKPTLAGASRSFTCKIDPPPLNYKLQWPLQHHTIAQQRARTTPDVPIVIDLTQDSPTPPRHVQPAVKQHIPIRDRKKKSAAYRHLHSIVTLIEHDRGRRRPPPDILKMKHAQQKRFSELQMLDTLARANSFSALGSELAHLSMNNTFSSLSNLSVQTCLNSLNQSLYSQYNGFNDINAARAYCKPDPSFLRLPGLVVFPDLCNMEMGSNGSIPSPAMPMVVPVIPRTDHWV